MLDETRILVVEDEAALSRAMRRFLEREGYDVSVADSGSSARRLVSRSKFDLILLDLNIPDEDGFSLLEQFQMNGREPVIIVSGKAKSVDRILGLEMGADDYISKPFNLREMQARIKAVLRRTAPGPHSTETGKTTQQATKLIRFAGWELDANKQELRSAHGERIVLTTGEFKLLEAFVGQPNRILSREQLLDWVSNRSWMPFDRSIDTQVQRLRKKIEPNPRHPELIRTIRGAGYIFTPKVEHREAIGP